MTGRQLISSGSEWEKTCGYSRAIRVGNLIEVAGTVALNDKNEVVGSDHYTQTKFIFEKISNALKETGCDMKDVIRTRMYTTDISQFQNITKAHGEIFRDIRPVCTLVEVSGLVRKEFLIEIEVTAIVSD
jgi:enamine deaminase RidA (YjgF/YER057c/UK114 family)